MYFCNNARQTMARAMASPGPKRQAKRWARRSAFAHPCKAAERLLLAVRALAGRGLACRERIDRSGAALLEVLVGLRFLLFLVAAHLSLGHDDLPGARLKRGGALAP